MSNIKITQLPALDPTPLAGTDVFPVVSGNVTYQVTANAIAAFAGGGANTGNVTFDNTTVQGVNGLQLSAGPDYTANVAYLQVRAGDQPSHIHLDTGDNAIYDLLVGDDSKYVQVGLGGNISIASYNGNTSTQYIWNYSNTGTASLATVNSESAQLTGTRKIIGGATTGATSAYSIILPAGGSPTVAYTSSPGVQSARVTFVTQSNGSAFQWEQFDVVVTPSGDVANAVNYVVSNRVKSTTTVPDTTVSAAMSGGQIEITLDLSAAQTSGGWASFDAVEFGLMVD